MPLDPYIAQRFYERGVKLYHAENLQDFRIYCAHRALLSRAELMHRAPHLFTVFKSDPSDATFGVLGRVFGNLNDFGKLFAWHASATPNLYGPIALVFKPSVFSRMQDIRITHRSIMTLGAQWAGAALTEPQHIDGLLAGDRFGNLTCEDWFACEVSSANPTLPFDELEYVLVEPIEIFGHRLIDLVEAELQAHHLSVPVQERENFSESQRKTFQELVSMCEELTPPARQDDWSLDPSRLPAVFRSMGGTKRKAVMTWCRYFTYGTVAPLREEAQEAWLDAQDDRTVCELCDPGEDRPPPLVNWPRSLDGESQQEADAGRCDWCNGLGLRCGSCGAIQGVYESQYDELLECAGGCGMGFIVHSSQDPDGDGYEHIEAVNLSDGEEPEPPEPLP